MKAGMIAAGRGERLARTGVSVPKPLVPILGEPMIARTIRIAAQAGVDELACVVNDVDSEVEEYLLSRQWPLALHLVKRTTANSLESFSLLPSLLGSEPFLLFTVDAVFRLSALSRFIAGVRALPRAHAVFALTRFVDDANPLTVAVAGGHVVKAIGEKAAQSGLCTAGFYWFRPSVFGLVETAEGGKLKAFRELLCLLGESAFPAYAIIVSRTIDVDMSADVKKAERYLKGEWEHAL